MGDVEVVATSSARPFTDSAADLRDLREVRKALRKRELRPGDAQFDLVYARALATRAEVVLQHETPKRMAGRD